jgi:hypothetical protein
MEATTLLFAGGTTRSWSPTADVLLVAFAGYGTAPVLSWDPSVSTGSFSAPLADSTDANVVGFGISAGNVVQLPSPVPISAGKTLFVAGTAKGSVILYYTLAE